MNLLKELRKSAKKTQKEMGELLGMTESAYNLIENKKRGLKVDIAMQIGTILGIAWYELYEESDNEEQ